MFRKIKENDKNFNELNVNEEFCKLMYPSNTQTAKLSNTLIKMMFESRNKIDLGQQINSFEA